MIAKNVVYKYGHFYNAETGERLIIKEDSEMILLLPQAKDSFLPRDLLQTPFETRTDQAITEQLEKKKGFKKCAKLLPPDSLLCFNISSGFEENGQKKRVQYTFELLLNESLFIYRTSASSLAECSCTVTRVVDQDMRFFEPIEAYSLNDAYMKTYVHYFNTFGKGTCNAFDTFYQQLGQKKSFVRQLRTQAGYDQADI